MHRTFPMLAAAAFAVQQISRRFVRDERGAILVLFGVMLPVLLIIIGLAVDVGGWYALQRQNQSAADAAALSAAYEYAYSSGPKLTEAQLRPFATDAASRNRYSGRTPEVHLLGGGRVQAILNQDQGAWISALAGLTNVNIKTSAIARVEGGKPGCIIALSQNAVNGIYVQGSATILAPDCTLVSNSSNADSVFLHDNGVNITAFTVVTAGNVGGHVNARTFNLEQPPQIGAPILLDPYASTLTHAALISGMPPSTTLCIKSVVGGVTTWVPPAGASGCTVIPAANCPKKNPPPNCFADGEKLSANTQIAGDWSPGGATTLPAGKYWITDGDLTVKNTQLTCTGCTIIMTTATNTKIGFVWTSANGNLNLIAPISGSFAGMVLIQDSVAGVPIDAKSGSGCDSWGLCLNANSAAQLSGLVYFPNSNVGFQGTPVAGSAQCLVLVANTIQLSGNPTLATDDCSILGLDTSDTSALAIKTVKLVE